MFSFFTKKQTVSSILPGFTDCHTHLLPEVDDGVQTMEDTLEILRLMELNSVKEVWLTPHIMEDMPNTTAALQNSFQWLKSRYTGAVTLHLAAEYMLDTLFEERLAQNDLLPHGGNTLLVETSYFNPPYGLDDILERIRHKGYTPLLAHPERYVYLGKDDYIRLKQKPMHFQLNLPSLAGYYGPQVQKRAHSLLKAGLYDCFGTDTHSLARFDELLRVRVHRISR